MSASPPKKMKSDKTKHFYKKQQNKKQTLENGMKGFLATCNFREKDCVRECYNILNEYANELYGPENKEEKATETTESKDVSKNAKSSDDIADVLHKEIAAISGKTDEKLQSKSLKRRFQQVDTGVDNCIFISTTLENPNELGAAIVKDLAAKKQSKTRYLLRLVPIEAVSSINMTDIVDTAGKVFDKHFLNECSSFSIIFNRRLNNSTKRDDVIKELASLVLVKNAGNRVDLKNPDKAVIVEVIKGRCCLSVIENYIQHKKYNLLELITPKNEGKPVDEQDAKNDNVADNAEHSEPEKNKKEIEATDAVPEEKQIEKSEIE